MYGTRGEHLVSKTIDVRSEREHPANGGGARMDRATHDCSCPNGCFELEIEAAHETRDPADVLDEIVRDDGTCPECGADLPEVRP